MSDVNAYHSPHVLRLGSAGQEVSWWDQDDSEDDADGLGEKTGAHPGAHQVQQPTQVSQTMMGLP